MSTDPPRPPQPSSDANGDFVSLLGRARAGDATALDALIRRAQPRLQARAAKTLGQWLRARTRQSDVVQDALVEVVQRFAAFAGHTESAFVHWIERIIESSAQRQQRYFTASKRSPAGGSPTSADPATLPNSSPTPSAVASSAESLAAYQRALGELTEDQRYAMEQVVLAGRPVAEVANELGRNPAALHALLGRARAALAVRLERAGLDRPGPTS